MKTLQAIILPLAAWSLSACAPDAPLPEPEAAYDHSQIYEWNDDGGPEDLKVRIDLGAQRAYFTRGDRQVGWSYVATGREEHNTPAGTYRVLEKIEDKHSTKYGWIENEYGRQIDSDASPGDPVPPGARYVAAPMPYWMRLTSYGIGMHAGIIPQPGSPASHGCIRLPKPLAPKLFEAVKVGTPVKIEYGQSDPWVVHPDPLPEDDRSRERMRDGLRVVDPDDPWIVWPEGHPRSNDDRL